MPASKSAKTSLRQRKKDLTRARIVEVAQQLFKKQGYDATTLEQIAEQALVSVPTLLVYFESKERLALAPEYDLIARFREQIEDPERSDDTVTLWRKHVEAASASAAKDQKERLRYVRFLGSSPTLARGLLSIEQHYEDVLAEGLGRDYGTDPQSDLNTRLLATMLSFGNRAAMRQWFAAGGTGDIRRAALAVIDYANEHLPKPAKRLRSRSAS